MEIKRVAPIEDVDVLSTMPNTVIVRNHLIRYGSITENDGRVLYGIGRVAPVIEQLRHKKEPLMIIETVLEEGKNRLGKDSRFGRWYFKGFVEDK